MKPLAKQILSWILPKRCLKCGDIVAEDGGGLCGDCWSHLTFISDPQCKCCGYPFEVSLNNLPGDMYCAPCLDQKPLYRAARSALIYNEHSKPILLRFKHGDATYQAPILSQWMKGADPDLFHPQKILVPVPLHWTRLFKRRYNQAALLAKNLQNQTQNEVILDGLIRTKATQSQGHLSPQDRVKNVKKVFKVNEKRLSKIQNQDIILVDDVLTSGATVEECTRTLLEAGAKSVDVLTLARVVRPEHMLLNKKDVS